MNTRAEIALENFVSEFDAFLTTCNELESEGRWDVDAYGFMSAYFESDLFAVALQIMSADGVFERAEAEVLDRMFSTEYTPRQLKEAYVSLKPVVDDYCDFDAYDALARLATIDKGLCETYRKLILDACSIVSMSDGVAEGEEQQLIEKLQAVLEERA